MVILGGSLLVYLTVALLTGFETPQRKPRNCNSCRTDQAEDACYLQPSRRPATKKQNRTHGNDQSHVRPGSL